MNSPLMERERRMARAGIAAGAGAGTGADERGKGKGKSKMYFRYSGVLFNFFLLPYNLCGVIKICDRNLPTLPRFLSFFLYLYKKRRNKKGEVKFED